MFALLFVFLAGKICPDLVSGLIRFDDLEPVFRRAGALLSLDLHDVTGMQFRIQRHHGVVYNRPDHGVADIGMDTVGKVNRRRAAGQIDNPAFRSHHIDVGLEDIVAQRGHQFAGIIGVFPGKLGKITEPRQFLLDFLLAGMGIVIAALFIAPVGRDTAFGDLIHLFGADLYFKDLFVLTDDGGMQRLVHIRLRNGNIVLQPARDRCIFGLDVAQDFVAVLLGLGNNADRQQVQNLIEALVLHFHFVIDGIEMLRTAENTEFQMVFRQEPGNVLDHRLNGFIPFRFLHFHQLGNAVIALPVQVEEAQVFELILDGTDTEPVGNRGIDIHGLGSDPLLGSFALVLQGPHVMQPVSQLDQNDADVLGHGNKQFAVIGRLVLRVILAFIRQRADLCYGLDNLSNFRSKQLAQFFFADSSVFDRIVQEAGRYGFRSDMQRCQDIGHIIKVHNIRFPAPAQLAVMLFFRKFGCPVNQIKAFRLVDIRFNFAVYVFQRDFLLLRHASRSFLYILLKNRRSLSDFLSYLSVIVSME